MTTASAAPDQINLTFHGVGEPEAARSPSEAQVWLSVEQFESILDARRCPRHVRISFDDGNVSDVELALPALTGAA